MTGDLTARLRATFVAELDDQARAMSAALLALEARPHDEELIRSLFRGAHTIKGAARVAGFPDIEHVCHALESIFEHVRDDRLTLGPDAFQLLFESLDALEAARDRLREGVAPDAAALARTAERLASAALAAPPAAPRVATPPPAAVREPAPRPREPATAPTAPTAPATAAPEVPAESEETVRVGADRLDSIAAQAGELLVASAAIAGQRREWLQFRDAFARWAARARRLAHNGGGAPGRAPRAAGPSADLDAELHRLVLNADRIARGAAARSATLQRVTSDVVAGVRALRLRRFADIVEALPRTIRDVATRTDKRITLQVEGADIEADRVVIDALRDPLLHLVRNAADHGIETPAARAAAGKPEEGTVRVAAALTGGRLRVIVEDDGAGIDAAAVRARIRQRGGVPPADDRQLARILFAGGITTRAEATELSGRGVGLDLVRTAVESLGGSVRLVWKQGRGARFILEAPPTPAALRALLVEAGGQVFAMPTANVERVVRIQAERVRRVDGRPVLTLGQAPVPLASLPAVLGPPLPDAPRAAGSPVVVLEAAGDRAAFTVDTLIDESEIVVRPLHAGALVPHITGGALLASGRIALVLSADSLVDAALQRRVDAPLIEAEEAAVRHRVIIADDSITTRTLEQSVLEAAGFHVTTAVDGQDAWEKLLADGADLLVADVEMPRLTGFELCQRARATKRFAELPIILITALDSPEDRARGLESGADAYITKSSFDQTTLLDVIRRLLG